MTLPYKVTCESCSVCSRVVGFIGPINLENKRKIVVPALLHGIRETKGNFQSLAALAHKAIRGHSSRSRSVAQPRGGGAGGAQAPWPNNGAGAFFQLFLGGPNFFLFFNATGLLLKNWKKQHLICSNLTLFIVPFFLFFSFFSFSFSFFFFSFFLFFFFLGERGGGPLAPPQMTPLQWRSYNFYRSKEFFGGRWGLGRSRNGRDIVL